MKQPGPDRLRLTAERRLLNTLGRLHGRDPLVPDIRVDAVVAELRRSGASRPASHRGGGTLPLTDAELRSVVDDLVERGELVRTGHRVRLPSHVATLPDAWRERADALLAALRAESPAPPRADAVARRLGLPEAALDYLRGSGELVSLAPGIDYPADVAEELIAVAQTLAEEGTLSVAALREAIGGTRRYAAAIIGALDDDADAS
ncbi:MAG: hypothetical protein ABI534_01525 [Chloroflexota bacterium]